MKGKVLSINISEKKGTPKTKINPGVLIEDFGFENDAHAGKWHRQVSLLAKESIEKSKNEFSAKKEKLVKDMDQKIISFYEKIRKWAGNSAVVKVKKQACYGCFMHINDKTYANVIRKDEIITCPHCGRILYKDNEE